MNSTSPQSSVGAARDGVDHLEADPVDVRVDGDVDRPGARVPGAKQVVSVGVGESRISRSSLCNGQKDRREPDPGLRKSFGTIPTASTAQVQFFEFPVTACSGPLDCTAMQLSSLDRPADTPRAGEGFPAAETFRPVMSSRWRPRELGGRVARSGPGPGLRATIAWSSRLVAGWFPPEPFDLRSPKRLIVPSTESAWVPWRAGRRRWSPAPLWWTIARQRGLELCVVHLIDHLDVVGMPDLAQIGAAGANQGTHSQLRAGRVDRFDRGAR